MTDTTITLELPRLFANTTRTYTLTPRLQRIVDRNRDHDLRAAMFALATIGFTLVASLGIAGTIA